MDDRGTKLELQDEDWVTLNFKRGWRSKKVSRTGSIRPGQTSGPGPGLQAARRALPTVRRLPPLPLFPHLAFETPSCLCLNSDEALLSARTQQRGSLDAPHSPISMSPSLLWENHLGSAPCRLSQQTGSGTGGGTPAFCHVKQPNPRRLTSPLG